LDSEEARAIGWALWRVRDDRGKSLRVVAELAGMSKDTLNRIERGLLSPTLDQVYALAEVLQVSVSELTRLPFPAPANGHTDSSVEAIGLALDAIECGEPAGLVLPVTELLDQVRHLHRQRRMCRFVEVATELPGLIRDIHTTLDTGTDHGELLGVAVYLHTHVTRMWLLTAEAPAHLLRRIVFLARRLAEERDEVATLAMAGYGVAATLLTRGAVEPGRVALDSLTLPPTTAGTAGLVSQVTQKRALAAVRDDRPQDADPALDMAAELAQRFGATSTDPLGFMLSPADVGIERMDLALRASEPDRAVSVATTLHPERHPFTSGQADFWRTYGRALAQLGNRHEDAVRALRTAEDIHPAKVLRDPLIRDTLAVLLRHSRRGFSSDQELRGMARRARLFV
jgi:transcriptional regulator with XRE-family HTH domain